MQNKVIIIVIGAVMIVGMIIYGCSQRTIIKSFPDPLARQFFVEGRVFLRHGEVDKAVESFSRAIRTAPDYFDPYYTLANTFVNLKQFDRAQAVLAQAGIHFPDNPFVFYASALAYRQSGQLRPAVMAARKSFDICQKKNDQDGMKQSLVLLNALIQTAKQMEGNVQ